MSTFIPVNDVPVLLVELIMANNTLKCTEPVITGFRSKRHQYGISTLESQTFLLRGLIRGARWEATAD